MGRGLCEDLQVALPADSLSSAPLADSTLYAGLDEVAEEQTQLFRCPEQDVPVSLSKPCLSPLVGGSGRRTGTHPQASAQLEHPFILTLLPSNTRPPCSVWQQLPGPGDGRQPS